MTDSIIIIGAGLSGLRAGRLLQDAGHQVRILDKGRRVGGRVSTRRAEGFLFNHGAQFVTARSDSFRTVCDAAEQAGQLALWPLEGRKQALSGTPSMRGLAEFMGQGVRIEQQREVESVSRLSDGSLRLGLTGGQALGCDHLLVTCPAPQTARLLAAAAPALATAADYASYAPCWTVMAGFSEPLDLPAVPIQQPTGILGWATYEAGRPEAGSQAALTLQATADYSQDHLEDPHDMICTALLDAFGKTQTIGLPVPSYLAAHRWRYAKVAMPCPPDDPFSAETAGKVIAVAGDWHPVSAAAGRPATGARAEDAFLSGERAARYLIDRLAQGRRSDEG